jgi:hypothetical protein
MERDQLFPATRSCAPDFSTIAHNLMVQQGPCSIKGDENDDICMR